MLNSTLCDLLCRLRGEVAVEAAARGAADAGAPTQKQHVAAAARGVVAAAARGVVAPSPGSALRLLGAEPAAPADAAGWALWPLPASRGVLSRLETQHPAA